MWTEADIGRVVTAYLVPEGDLREHIDGRWCWCRPYLSWDGEEYVWQHVALDLREFLDDEEDEFRDVGPEFPDLCITHLILDGH